MSFWRGCGEKAGKAPPTRCLSHAKLNCTKLHSTGCRLPAQKRHQQRQPCRHPAPTAPRRLGRCPSARRCLHRRGGGAQTARLVHRVGVDISGKGVRGLLGWRAAPKGPRTKGAEGPSRAGETGLALERAGTLSRAVVERFFTLVNANLHQRRLCGRVLHWIGRVGGEQHYPLVVSDQRVRLRGAPSGR